MKSWGETSRHFETLILFLHPAYHHHYHHDNHYHHLYQQQIFLVIRTALVQASIQDIVVNFYRDVGFVVIFDRDVGFVVKAFCLDYGQQLATYAATKSGF